MNIREEVWQAIREIIVTYPLLECDKCAIAVMKYLKTKEITGKVLRLKTKRRREIFIVSDRRGLDESITENGTHYGVEVFGKVFDNLSTEGLSREDWVNDFHCLSEQFILDELETLGESE